MKLCTVVGARPQFVKAAIVSRALRSEPGVREVLVHTGQHYDANMSDVFFSELDLASPDHNLGIGSGPHGSQTGRMLDGLEQVFVAEAPQVVVVYGDTNSTLAGALAAAKLHIPVAHVEAGLRSFNRRMPEEINRVLADSLADVLFAPTSDAVSHLMREGVADTRIVLTGDVMYDAALLISRAARERSCVLQSHGVTPRKYVLATVHRAENTDDIDRLSNILGALELVAETYHVVWPLHPRARVALQRSGLLERACRSLRIIEPVGYVDMVRLEMDAVAIASDSGGVQKEAFFHGVPCWILRDETEWMELVDAGWNTLVPPQDPSQMAAMMLQPRPQPRQVRPYGNGDAAQLIVQDLVRRYS